MALMEMKVMTKIAQMIKNVTEGFVIGDLVVVHSKSKNKFFLKCVYLKSTFSICKPKDFCITSYDCKDDSEVCARIDGKGKCVELHWKSEKCKSE